MSLTMVPWLLPMLQLFDDDGIDEYNNHCDVEKDNGNVYNDNDDIREDDTSSSIFLSISYNNEVDVHDDER